MNNPVKFSSSEKNYYNYLGIECIELTKNVSFPVGSIIKYLYRYPMKNKQEDLKKALQYLRFMCKNFYNNWPILSVFDEFCVTIDATNLSQLANDAENIRFVLEKFKKAQRNAENTESELLLNFLESVAKFKPTSSLLAVQHLKYMLLELDHVYLEIVQEMKKYDKKVS